MPVNPKPLSLPLWATSRTYEVGEIVRVEVRPRGWWRRLLHRVLRRRPAVVLYECVQVDWFTTADGSRVSVSQLSLVAPPTPGEVC